MFWIETTDSETTRRPDCSWTNPCADINVDVGMSSDIKTQQSVMLVDVQISESLELFQRLWDRTERAVANVESRQCCGQCVWLDLSKIQVVEMPTQRKRMSGGDPPRQTRRVTYSSVSWLILRTSAGMAVSGFMDRSLSIVNPCVRLEPVRVLIGNVQILQQIGRQRSIRNRVDVVAGQISKAESCQK